jgi:hypothetical protein
MQQNQHQSYHCTTQIHQHINNQNPTLHKYNYTTEMNM